MIGYKAVTEEYKGIPIHFLAMVIRYPRSFVEAVRVKHSMRKNGKAKS